MGKAKGKTLVEILAKELKEWPEHSESAVQDSDKEVRFAESQYDFFASELAIEDKEISCWDGMPFAGPVTREMWEAERAKLEGEKVMRACVEKCEPESKQKANAQGWIRNRGRSGVCPAEPFQVIEVRDRDGYVYEVGPRALRWHHIGNGGDIMAWRPISAEQASAEKAFDACVEKCASTEPGHAEMPAAKPIGGPLQWRDRITEIDRTVEALEEERLSLVQLLADEGLQLIGKKADKVESLPREDWRVGDLVVRVVDGEDSDMPLNTPLPVTFFDGSKFGQDVCVDGFYYPKVSSLKWHSRPSK